MMRRTRNSGNNDRRLIEGAIAAATVRSLYSCPKLDLTDNEQGALAGALRKLIDNDQFPFLEPAFLIL